MFHDLPHWAFKLLGSLLGAAVLFLLLSLSHIPSAAHGDSQLALVHTTDTTLVPTLSCRFSSTAPPTCGADSPSTSAVTPPCKP